MRGDLPTPLSHALFTRAPSHLHVTEPNTLLDLASVIGVSPTCNAQTSDFVQANAIGEETVKETTLVSNPTGSASAVACKKDAETTGGRYKGHHRKSPDYEYAWALEGFRDSDYAANAIEPRYSPTRRSAARCG